MSLEVRFDSKEITRLAADVKKAGGNAERLIQAATVNSVNRIQREQRRRAPHRTGSLQRGIIGEVSGLEGIVQATEKYSEWIEFGTGIYGPEGRPITPKNKPILAWRGEDGRWRRAKQVKGMKAQPFFMPGYEAALGYVNGQYDKVIDKITLQMAGRTV